MALPADLDLVPVRGQYVRLDGAAVSGKVTFTSTTVLTSPRHSTTVVPTVITATLDSNGAFEVFLPATDDPDIAPSGWTYGVKEDFPAGGRSFAIQVPLSAKTDGLDLSTVAPVSAAVGNAAASFVLLGAFNDLKSRVTAIETDGGSSTPVDLSSYSTTSQVDQKISTATAGVSTTATTAAVAAVAARVPASLSNYRGLSPVCAHASGPLGTAASGLLGGTNRQFFPFVDQTKDFMTVTPVWENYLGGADQGGANAITVAAAVEVGATIVPFSFGGNHLAVLQPGGTLLPDVGIQVPATSVAYAAGAGTGSIKGVWIRTYVSVTTGQSYPVNAWPGLVSGELIGESAAGAADLTLAGSAAPVAGGGAFAAGFGPRAVLGKAASSRVWVGFGDSKLNGQGDNPNMYGYFDRATLLDKIPGVKVGRPGDTVGNFTANQRYRRAAWIDGATDVLIAYGVNDLNNGGRTPAQVITDMTNAAAWVTALGKNAHLATIGPRTTSTDSFATTANQTATGSGGTILPSNLATVNDALRALPGGAVGCFDIADIEMSARNSGLWAPGKTSDGVHPVTAVHVAEAAALAAYRAAH